MARHMITLNIDVTKIDKDRLFTGKKGTYLDLVVFLDDEKDQYGNNGFVVQSISEQERKAGMKGNILGNAKILPSIRSDYKPEPIPKYSPAAITGDDLPF